MEMESRMEIYKDYLKDFVQFHKDLRQNYTKQLKRLPRGSITGRKYKDTYQYYHLLNANGTYTRRGIGKNDHLKGQLARKEYLKRVLPILDKNIKVLEHAYKQYQPIKPDSIIGKMSNVYQSLPQQYFIDKAIMSEELQNWMNTPFDQSDLKPEEKIHTTSRGLKVRTRAELIIAEALYMYNIAFRYEQRLYIRNRRFAPDFTIKLPDGRIIYWEHAGKTHEKKYMLDHYDKLLYYLHKGIVPGENLILTYDSVSGEFNTQAIHSEIKNRLLSS